MAKLRTEYRFTLPRGTGIKVEAGRKVSGTMRLIKVKDLVDIERDSQVQRGTGAYYVVLLSRCITELGLSTSINRSVDFMNEINHQVIKRLPLQCSECGHEYEGIISQLGEA